MALTWPDPSVRERAIERLCMAVFFAEASSVHRAGEGDRLPSSSATGRLAWLLAELEKAHARFDDVIPAMLHNLRYHGDRETPADWVRNDARVAAKPECGTS